jgi:hypothetical protein
MQYDDVRCDVTHLSPPRILSHRSVNITKRLTKDETHLNDHYHYINSITSHTDLSTPTSSSALTHNPTVTIIKGIVQAQSTISYHSPIAHSNSSSGAAVIQFAIMVPTQSSLRKQIGGRSRAGHVLHSSKILVRIAAVTQYQ